MKPTIRRNEEKYQPRHSSKAPENSISVFNLNLKISLEEMIELFSVYGVVNGVNTYWTKVLLKGTINVKVIYDSKASCEKARDNLNEAELDGFNLKIRINN